jgi:hypothetical protein
MKSTVTLSALAVALYALTGLAGAADQTILGRSLLVKDPGSPDRRKITSNAKESASPDTIVGDPTLSGGGGVLTVIANGANPTSQIFNLPQGIDLSGKSFWTTNGVGGFKYRDRKGDQGPVRSVSMRKTAGGNFMIKAVIRAQNGPVNVVPPNPGSDGFVTLQITGGDRYCMQYGADGKVINKGTKLFKVRRPKLQGCPGGGQTTTTTSSTGPITSTTTSSTTTTTMYSSPSRAFLDAPIDLLD